MATTSVFAGSSVWSRSAMNNLLEGERERPLPNTEGSASGRLLRSYQLTFLIRMLRTR
jgi:hypothetical protein